LSDESDGGLLKLEAGDLIPDKIKKETAEAIYQEYPRKVAKKPGIKAIEKALKTNTAPFLIERTKMFAADVKGKDKQFIPHSATWFNEERFNDDPEESKQKSTPKSNHAGIQENIEIPTS
jgi:hypothetical protein